MNSSIKFDKSGRIKKKAISIAILIGAAIVLPRLTDVFAPNSVNLSPTPKLKLYALGLPSQQFLIVNYLEKHLYYCKMQKSDDCINDFITLLSSNSQPPINICNSYPHTVCVLGQSNYLLSNCKYKSKYFVSINY